ncbi:MAG: RNA-binding protein [Thermoprotei archaeon]|nr:MAG: RNA-binding protein [Thermoprotei archaeon]
MKDPFQRKDIVTVRIGKLGITPKIIKELDNVLKARGIVKIRLLKNFRDAYDTDRSEVAQLLSQELRAKIVGIRGYSIILQRPRAKHPRSQSRKTRRQGR